MNKRRKFVSLPFGAVAGALAFASVAYACTDVKGTAEITQIIHKSAATGCGSGATTTCAAPGDTIKVRGVDGPRRYVSGTDTLIHYFLYLLPEGDTADDGMETCMPGGGPTGQESVGSTSVPMMKLTDNAVHAIGDDENSYIPETTATVPELSSSMLGPAWVCFMGGGWTDSQSTDGQLTNKVASRFLAMNSTTYDTLQIVLI